MPVNGWLVRFHPLNSPVRCRELCDEKKRRDHDNMKIKEKEERICKDMFIDISKSVLLSSWSPFQPGNGAIVGNLE